MQSIHRFNSPIQTKIEIQLPLNAVVVSALVHPPKDPGSAPTIDFYAVVNTAEKDTRARWFAIVKTGENLPDSILDCRHIISLPGGAHIWEIGSQCFHDFAAL